MSSALQTALSLGLVVVALGGLIWRAVASRKHSGGGCSGCPTDSFKENLKRKA
jgi:hypothetical protein